MEKLKRSVVLFAVLSCMVACTSANATRSNRSNLYGYDECYCCEEGDGLVVVYKTSISAKAYYCEDVNCPGSERIKAKGYLVVVLPCEDCICCEEFDAVEAYHIMYGTEDGVKGYVVQEVYMTFTCMADGVVAEYYDDCLGAAAVLTGKSKLQKICPCTKCEEGCGASLPSSLSGCLILEDCILGNGKLSARYDRKWTKMANCPGVCPGDEEAPCVDIIDNILDYLEGKRYSGFFDICCYNGAYGD